MTGQVGRYVASTLAHLLIGLPVGVALLAARWYAAYGHCGNDDLGRSGLDDCTYNQIEDSGFVLIGLILFGVLSVLLLLLYDYLRPRIAELPLAPRLLTLPAVLLPYAVYVANGG